MSAAESASPTLLLHRAADGHAESAARLLPLVYDELRRLAHHYLAGERPGSTLQATALVHEAYLKLIVQQGARFETQAHFFALAAQAMRRILVDQARARASLKRGGPGRAPVSKDGATATGQRRIDLTQSALLDPRSENDDDLISLDQALKNLKELDERQAHIVECFYFGGLTVEQTAAVIGVSARTISGELMHARAWLRCWLDRA